MNQIVNTSVTRRQFVVSSASAAGGLAISVAFAGLADAASIGAQAWGADTAPNEINAFLAIDPDGSILIRSPHNEMGQGAITALPMIVAEELECDWSKVKVEYASPARNLREKDVYGDMVTAGSRGVRTSWQMLLQAGASARVRLIAAAAQRWNVPEAECEAANSKVTHKTSGRSLDYGALAADAGKIKLDKEPAIRTPDQFKLIGKPLPRLDTPLKINGSAKFAIDTQVPGMVYAAIAACPVFGGKLKSVDESPGQGPARRAAGGQARQCGGGGRRPLLARQGGARAAQARMGRGRGRQDRQRAIRQALPRHARRADGERAQRRQCR